MKFPNLPADAFFTSGCGRCSLGGTPDCKVHRWTQELALLREIVLSCGLTEEHKWGVACYTFNKKNVVILGAFKEYCSISFFKGSLLKDPDQMLDKPGENSQASRLIRFTKVKDIIKIETVIRAFVIEAIEIEKSGQKVSFKKIEEHPVPEEFKKVLKQNPEIKKAFSQLTPGRQRGYLIYFAAPKQSETRVSRIEKSIPDILKGKGIHDRS